MAGFTPKDYSAMEALHRSTIARNLDLFIATRAVPGLSRALLFNGKMLTAVRAVELDVGAGNDWFYWRRDAAFADSSDKAAPNYRIAHNIDLALCSLSGANSNCIGKRFYRHNVLNVHNSTFQ
jgi:hypothetical protein